MGPVKEHMRLLATQVPFKNEKPLDQSFQPLSLCLTTLLRRPPKQLQEIADFPIHQLDHSTSIDAFMAIIPSEDAYQLFKGALVHLKLCRGLLSVLNDHLMNKIDHDIALNNMSNIVTQVLEPNKLPVKQPMRPKQVEIQPATPLVETRMENASIALQKAIKNDRGSGDTIIQVMKRYPKDLDLQTTGLATLKHGMKKKLRTKKRVAVDMVEIDSNHHEQEQKTTISGIQVTLSAMRNFPTHRRIQLNGVLTLVSYVELDQENYIHIAGSGGLSAIMEAMVLLPDEREAQIAALGMLGNPMIADERVIRVTAESRRLVLSAMKRFPQDEQIQGLGILALTNLGKKHVASIDEIAAKGGFELIVQSMKTFPTNSSIQAAGCFAIGTFSAKDGDLLDLALTAGAIPICERARKQFPNDSGVQHNATIALNVLLETEDEPEGQGNCKMQ